MSGPQPLNHWAWGCEAILSICAASAGRVARNESAVAFALEVGFTQKLAPTIGLPVTGTGAAGLGIVKVPLPFPDPVLPLGENTLSEHAAKVSSAAAISRVFSVMQLGIFRQHECGCRIGMVAMRGLNSAQPGIT